MLIRFRHFAERLCAYDHCRILLPWFVWATRTDPSSRLRRRILQIDYGCPLSSVGFPLKIIAAGLHLTRVLRELLIYWSRYSVACKKGFGISRMRQLATMLVSTFRYNFPPSLYYRARLFRLQRSRWLSLFSHEEIVVILIILESRTEHLGVWNKSDWAQFCTSHGFPSVPTLARIAHRKLTVLDAAQLQKGHDLFLKPDRDYSSHGTVMLEWQPLKHGWQAIGTTEGFVPQADIAEFIINASKGGHVIVQPRLRTHPDLADLATRALINVRVITIRSSEGNISIKMAALKIPLGSEHSSDVIGSGLFIPIDTTSGTLGRAESTLIELGSMSHHPRTQAVIEGRVISQWPEMKAQALAAHAKLPLVPTIGWDLVPTAQGVLILEANVVWSTNLAQLRGLAPLGESNWPSVMLEYLDSLKHDDESSK